jgi:GNAT superfamily N-acetyltransferase
MRLDRLNVTFKRNGRSATGGKLSGVTTEQRADDQDLRATLRAAQVSDSRSIAQFHTRCWREAYRGLVPQDYLDRVDVDDRAVRWRDRLVNGGRRAAVAEYGGQIVGVVSWARSRDAGSAPPLELKSLYVAAAYRGSGIAADLLDRAIGTQAAHLWVFEDNPRAHRFYRKHGFAPDGERDVDADTGLWELRMVRGR